MVITQKDIAEKLNLSRSMVGLVLSNNPKARVSPATRREILRISEELGYMPNTTATNLRTGRTNAVVSICKFSPNDQSVQLERGSVDALAVALSLMGLELKLRPYPTIADALAGIDDLASKSVCDAVILWLEDEETELAGIALERHGIPFVAAGNYEERHPHWLQIDFDHCAMMRICVEHLLSAGRTRIAYMGYDDGGQYRRRLQDGFLSAVRELTGAHEPDEWICHISEDGAHADACIDGWLDHSEKGGPDSLVLGTGNVGWVAVERALARRKRRIGTGDGDFSVTGLHAGWRDLIYGHAMAFGDIQLSRLSSDMARLIGHRLKNRDAVPNPVVRIVPDLVEVGSMEMPFP